MLSLMIALAALAQDSSYVADYKPKVGDKLVLAQDLEGRKVPVFKSEGSAGSFAIVLKDMDEENSEAILGGDEIVEVDANTPVQILAISNLYKDFPIATIRYLSGPSKGKTTYTLSNYCRKPDLAKVKALAASRKKRGPLDKAVVLQDLKEALAKANISEARGDLGDKKKLVRETVQTVAEKHSADFTELFELARADGLSVKIDRKEYDVAGNLIARKKK